MNQSVTEKFKVVRLLAMDFDGIMTDGCVYVGEDGREMVKCSRKDGLGMDLLKKHGLDAVVISRETNPVVAARCRKLEIECEQAAGDGQGKLDILKQESIQRGAGEGQHWFGHVASRGLDWDIVVLFKVNARAEALLVL